jgi:hypothetical protein
MRTSNIPFGLHSENILKLPILRYIYGAILYFFSSLNVKIRVIIINKLITVNVLQMYSSFTKGWPLMEMCMCLYQIMVYTAFNVHFLHAAELFITLRKCQLNLTFSFALPACFCTDFASNAPLLSAIFPSLNLINWFSFHSFVHSITFKLIPALSHE